MTKIDVQLTMEKETKNTVRYQEEPEEGSPPKIGTLYIQKWTLGTTPPQRIRVTVEDATEVGS